MAQVHLNSPQGTSPASDGTALATLNRLRQLKWWLPLGLLLLVAAYEFGISRMVLETWGSMAHYILDLVVFGTVGPILTFAVISFLIRWMEERQTNELQAKILQQAREYARHHHEFTDSTLQSLFATSLFLQALTSNRQQQLPPAVNDQLQTINQSLDATIRSLREHLLRQEARDSEEKK